MPDELSSEEVKRCELGILSEVASFCEANDIHYSLTFGTLIGAIRHRGFIPWDDDIDIAIPRKEYELFFEKFKHDYYLAIEHSKDTTYPYAFGKVVDTRTVVIEQTTSPYPMGVYIDVFPVDIIPDGEDGAKHQKRCSWLCRAALYKMVSLNYPTDHIHKLIHTLIKLLLIPFSQNSIVNKQIKTAKQYCDCNFDNCGIQTIRLGCKKSFSRTMFLDRIKTPFEKQNFYIPKEYDLFLRSMYGDYMTPPPENQRIAHYLKAYWK